VRVAVTGDRLRWSRMVFRSPSVIHPPRWRSAGAAWNTRRRSTSWANRAHVWGANSGSIRPNMMTNSESVYFRLT